MSMDDGWVEAEWESEWWQGVKNEYAQERNEMRCSGSGRGRKINSYAVLT